MLTKGWSISESMTMSIRKKPYYITTYSHNKWMNGLLDEWTEIFNRWMQAQTIDPETICNYHILFRIALILQIEVIIFFLINMSVCNIFVTNIPKLSIKLNNVWTSVNQSWPSNTKRSFMWLTGVKTLILKALLIFLGSYNIQKRK